MTDPRPAGHLRHRYWNANGMGIAVVAVGGGAGDWAAYIGAQPDELASSEWDTVRWTARHGCKLSLDEATGFFPSLARDMLTYRN